jgi:hypothetical protein
MLTVKPSIQQLSSITPPLSLLMVAHLNTMNLPLLIGDKQMGA